MPIFTNSHIHIFSGQYAPDYYLKVALPRWLDWSAPYMKTFLEGKKGRIFTGKLLKVLNFTSPKKRKMIERYLEFVRTGTLSSQEAIFKKVSESYQRVGHARFVPLTLNMDHMDVELKSTHYGIDTQLKDMERLKLIYPNELFPFVSVDPRHPVNNLLNWLQEYLRPDGAFYGIKLYPGKGYFPFDPRLDTIYKWAEDAGIPIMTHCTRTGSFYVGKIEKQLFSNPATLNIGAPEMASIYNRINAVINDKGIHKKNDIWCNVYNHPENYIPVLRKYPKLKLCFAHLGGSTEVIDSPNIKGPAYLGPNWFNIICNLLSNTDYPNIYADISYTLYDLQALKKINATLGNHDRLLYGTDFYMTEQEESNEPVLIDQFFKIYGTPGVTKLAYTNPQNYLQSAKLKPLIP